MKALIWKEWSENLKWVPLPGLVILIVFLIARPFMPMPGVTQAFFNALVAVGFAAALGFVQIYSEGQGDKRSLLLHRPLSPSRIFLAKALAGVGLYVVALGIPLVCLESWLAMPGKANAPYHWRIALPWLADILSGLVYYFAGMLLAQREVRWYGSRGFALGAALLCSCLVWGVPEFWQALVAIGIIGSFVATAAWGSFCTGGSYAWQPGPAKAALAVTLLAGLTMVSMLGKQLIGEWTESGIEWDHRLDRGGRVLLAPFKEGVGAVGPWIDVIASSWLHGQPQGNRSIAVTAIAAASMYSSRTNTGRLRTFGATTSLDGVCSVMTRFSITAWAASVRMVLFRPMSSHENVFKETFAIKARAGKASFAIKARAGKVSPLTSWPFRPLFMTWIPSTIRFGCCLLRLGERR